MVARPWQKRRTDIELNKDFLSSLPSEIIEDILVKLPIKEAARTSVLSSNWKSLWTSMPDLVFNDDRDTTESDLIRRVDKVLQVHQGPILKFEVQVGSDKHVGEEAIRRWLLALSKNELKDLCLNFDIYQNCKVPSILFSYQKLENLEIQGCTISAPQCFHGLKLLRNLILCDCELVGITIEKLVSSCPLLESLTLIAVVKQGCLVIRAPNLKELVVLDGFTDLLLEAPKLISASISVDYMLYGLRYFIPAYDGCKSKLLRAIGALPNIEELDIDSLCCEYLASGSVPEKLPITFSHLKKISIGLDERRKMVDIALCIFQSTPNLKTLKLKACCLTFPSQNIWEDQRIRTISVLQQLEVAVISSSVMFDKDGASMLAFAKFILSTASQLEKLVVDRWSFNDLLDSAGFMKKLLSLPRLSSKVVILVDERSSY
ncbi:F-box family protein [Rhynchospora pubera]|uniref:F-box family protein n=1 Tax=Rhynchospora pubera TaxID=906938 RepID=A0AAV8D285_9POAL|nr:F-box family protein [Rhynchospora pubera]KAJ4813312.1 F-box family protein [Rhynchospora pubera]